MCELQSTVEYSKNFGEGKVLGLNHVGNNVFKSVAGNVNIMEYFRLAGLYSTISPKGIVRFWSCNKAVANV